MEAKPETLLDVLRAMRSASMQCYKFAERIEDALIADEAKRGADSGVESAAKRVIAAFEAHGNVTPYTRESQKTLHECESAMVALDDALKLNLQPNARNKPNAEGVSA